ncbi:MULTISPECIES: hypothetical protein [unclassified Anaerobiospirillum]|nr:MULTISPECIES: hypothetical protein [unclassified Anaerobiospirillum]MCK0526538.1 hypothetical protein [Anaerobiospirillum sp. NML120449]MCK0534800.1 hypothetical protein [Anaerobiospirillum sp. NML120511]
MKIDKSTRASYNAPGTLNSSGKAQKDSTNAMTITVQQYLFCLFSGKIST